MNENSPKLWYGRGYLPHFDGGEVTQFITFRLSDSLPQNVLEKWKIEVEQGLITEIEFHRLVDKYLDNGIGNCYLKDERIAKLIEETLLFFDGQKYKLIAWVLMPNHVHLLLIPKNNFSLSEIMHSIKSYTSHEANKILGRKGNFWSKEYFDRFMRDYEHFAKTIAYIENNPVKAGLCEKANEWQFSSAFV